MIQEETSVEFKIGNGLLLAYNRKLREHPLWAKHLGALNKWQRKKDRKTGNCSNCGKKAKTHFHHKDVSLKPKMIRSIPLEIWYVPVRSILDLTTEEIIEAYFKKMEVKKNIRYFSVSRSALLELCPQCHRKAHSKDGL